MAETLKISKKPALSIVCEKPTKISIEDPPEYIIGNAFNPLLLSDKKTLFERACGFIYKKLFWRFPALKERFPKIERVLFKKSKDFSLVIAEQLSAHTFVWGTTGSGKSNLSALFLADLWGNRANSDFDSVDHRAIFDADEELDPADSEAFYLSSGFTLHYVGKATALGEKKILRLTPHKGNHLVGEETFFLVGKERKDYGIPLFVDDPDVRDNHPYKVFSDNVIKCDEDCPVVDFAVFHQDGFFVPNIDTFFKYRDRNPSEDRQVIIMGLQTEAMENSISDTISAFLLREKHAAGGHGRQRKSL